MVDEISENSDEYFSERVEKLLGRYHKENYGYHTIIKSHFGIHDTMDFQIGIYYLEEYK